MPVSVIKKDGSRELFDKQKLFTGISRACEKTNFSSEAIINFVDGIESQIVQDSNKDIKSSQIGELILKNLRKENEVAYIRYASVYRKFNGVKDFISTLESLKEVQKPISFNFIKFSILKCRIHITNVFAIGLQASSIPF